MTSPDNETSKDVFISLCEQIAAKITADMLEGSGRSVGIEKFTPGMKQSASTIYAPQIQMNLPAKQAPRSAKLPADR
jgi:hypothetical protein